MFERFVPAGSRRYIANKIREAVEPKLPHPVFFPYCPDQRAYLIPNQPESAQKRDPASDDDPFEMPPQSLLGGYAQSRAGYLQHGLRDVSMMREVAESHGAPLADSGRILDFGCATGRMIRALRDLVERQEIWGTDIDANRITWCQQYLSPPFHFLTTTTDPHLPFEDRYFGFIYAGSVFTHIDDLADAWFMELRRILSLQGRMYITIHDKHTIEAAQGDSRDNTFSQWLQEYPEYLEYVQSDFGKFTIERALHSQVFYSMEYLQKRLEPFLRILAVKPRAYGMQTAVLIERVS